MKKNPVPLPARIVRTNIILTGVIPALIPWFAIFFHYCPTNLKNQYLIGLEALSLLY